MRTTWNGTFKKNHQYDKKMKIDANVTSSLNSWRH